MNDYIIRLYVSDSPAPIVLFDELTKEEMINFEKNANMVVLMVLGLTVTDKPRHILNVFQIISEHWMPEYS